MKTHSKTRETRYGQWRVSIVQSDQTQSNQVNPMHYTQNYQDRHQHQIQITRNRDCLRVVVGMNNAQTINDWKALTEEPICVIDPTIDPSDYRWMVKDADVLLADCGQSDVEYRLQLALTLFLGQASSVRFIRVPNHSGRVAA